MQTKLKCCEEFLKKWAGQLWDNLGKKIVDLRKQRVSMMKGGKRSAADFLDISRQIEKAIEAEAYHWKQRARLNWLANGDRNTGALHARATSRRKKNYIKGLEDRGGVWREDEKEKVNIIRDFFVDLFSSTNPNSEEIEAVTNLITERVPMEDVGFLSRPYLEDEVKRAVFDTHPSKSPGPDGFTVRFFQRFWPVIGEYVTVAVLRILNGEEDIEGWNETLLILIPKVEEPRKVSDFRPLSLCNTSYKIISKVIVNRIRCVLGRVIDQNQSAFI